MEKRIRKLHRRKRFKELLINAVGLFAEGYSDWYNSDNEFLEYLYGELGTDEAEIKELGVDLSDIL